MPKPFSGGIIEFSLSEQGLRFRPSDLTFYQVAYQLVGFPEKEYMDLTPFKFVVSTN